MTFQEGGHGKTTTSTREIEMKSLEAQIQDEKLWTKCEKWRTYQLC
jgi:hypothetical protein